MTVKVCGLRTPAEVTCALEAGADLVGFVHHPPSPRHLEWEALAEVVRASGAASRAVLVTVDADPEALRAVPQAPHERLVLLARGAAAAPLLPTLAEHGDLVDRLAAVVCIGGELQGADVQEAFTHERLEPEVLRAIPYFSLVVVDPAEPLGRAWSAQRLPVPPVPPSGRIGIDRIDLGVLAEGGVDEEALARALLHVLAVRHSG